MIIVKWELYFLTLRCLVFLKKGVGLTDTDFSEVYIQLLNNVLCEEPTIRIGDYLLVNLSCLQYLTSVYISGLELLLSS